MKDRHIAFGGDLGVNDVEGGFHHLIRFGGDAPAVVAMGQLGCRLPQVQRQ